MRTCNGTFFTSDAALVFYLLLVFFKLRSLAILAYQAAVLLLMTSRGVEGTWMRTGRHGRFRGEWVKKKCKNYAHFLTRGYARAYHELLQGQGYANDSLAHS